MPFAVLPGRERQRISLDFPVCVAFRRAAWPGKATNSGVFLGLRCLLGFLPALKATDFAGFPGLRCLLPLSRLGKATFFDDFLDLRCLLGFLPALKTTDFAGFPGLRCLSPLCRAKTDLLISPQLALRYALPQVATFAVRAVALPAHVVCISRQEISFSASRKQFLG